MKKNKPYTTNKVDERRSICEKCPYFKRKSIRCSKCNCALVLKIQLNWAKCPDNRW